MTTSEIAKKLGISRGTLSRVLNNHPNVNPETRKRVLEALKELNYIPNETARSLVMQKEFHIAVIVFSQPAFFWAQVQSGVSTAQNDLASQGVIVDYFVTDMMKPEEQLELIRTLPQKGYDGIAVAPNNPRMLASEIDRLSNSGFPVVIINVEIPTANQLCYIGCDYIQSGILAGELFSRFLPDRSDLLVLTLKDSVYAIEQRITGFRKELSKHEHLNIKRIERFNRDGSRVYEVLLDLLKESPDFQGIYVSFDALVQTADAVQALNLTPAPVIVGYDLNEHIFERLKNKYITATICHEPFNQGYFAVKILHRYLLKKVHPSSSLMYNKLEVVMASNAKYYMNETLQTELFATGSPRDNL